MVDFEKIGELRERRKLSKSDAARAASIPVQRWHDIETGRFPDLRISTIDKIAAALGVKAKDLLK